jgi:predicted transcriptional regulator
MKKNFKQKELIDMIKKALINLKIKRALKFSSNIEIEKIAVHIIPVYDCDPALLSRLTETQDKEDLPLLVSSSDGFAISSVPNRKEMNKNKLPEFRPISDQV